MTTSPRTVLLILFLMSSIVALGQSSSATSEADIINRIIHQTGIAGQVTDAPKEMQKQFASNPLGLEPSKNERMINLFAKAFVEDSLVEEVQNTFKKQYDPALAEKTNSWIMEESTRNILKAEEDFYTLQGSRKRIVRKYELEQEPASEERTKVIESLIDATSAIESAIESQVILFRSIISAFSNLSDQQTFSESQIEGIVGNYRLQIQSQIEQEIANRLLIMYYDLETDTLKEYISFYESKPGNWLSETTSKSIHSAFKKAADRFVESVNSPQ